MILEWLRNGMPFRLCRRGSKTMAVLLRRSVGKKRFLQWPLHRAQSSRRLESSPRCPVRRRLVGHSWWFVGSFWFCKYGIWPIMVTFIEWLGDVGGLKTENHPKGMVCWSPTESNMQISSQLPGPHVCRKGQGGGLKTVSDFQAYELQQCVLITWFLKHKNPRSSEVLNPIFTEVSQFFFCFFLSFWTHTWKGRPQTWPWLLQASPTLQGVPGPSDHAKLWQDFPFLCPKIGYHQFCVINSVWFSCCFRSEHVWSRVKNTIQSQVRSATATMAVTCVGERPPLQGLRSEVDKWFAEASGCL